MSLDLSRPARVFCDADTNELFSLSCAGKRKAKVSSFRAKICDIESDKALHDSAPC